MRDTKSKSGAVLFGEHQHIVLMHAYDETEEAFRVIPGCFWIIFRSMA